MLGSAALKLVDFLSGLNHRAAIALIPARDRSGVQYCQNQILHQMARRKYPLEFFLVSLGTCGYRLIVNPLAAFEELHESYWTFTLDLAFGRNTRFANFIFKGLHRLQKEEIVKAVEYIVVWRDRLHDHKREHGEDSKITDGEEKEQRIHLREMLSKRIAEMGFEHWVGKGFQDIVSAVNCAEEECKYGLQHELFMLGRPEGYEM